MFRSIKGKVNLYKINFYCYVFLCLVYCCSSDVEASKTKDNSTYTSTDSIKLEYYLSKVSAYSLFSQKRQQYLDSALQIQPKNSYFWQQKAMPLYKARKYSLGKPFLKKAVLNNPQRYLDYSAFMKCIFSKEYEESIEEFLACKTQFGDSYVMDHTYNFYIGLNYLQLNQFKKAKAFLLKSKDQQVLNFPEESEEEACHFLDWFYIGIADYELGNFEEAISSFDKSLKVQDNFADALFYKASCYLGLNQKEKADLFFSKAYENKEYSISEDNSYYEIYPYQIFHKLSVNEF